MHRSEVPRPSSCWQCGGSIDEQQRFCGWCGSKLAPGSSLGVDRAAERKQVTILFADVVGSTAMLDGFDSERSADLLDPLLSDIATIISAHSGFVGAAAGDGLKALFGVPIAAKDHAERGCRAALQIREMARGRRVSLRIGLHSGEVVVRHLRPDLFADVDGVGLPVHVAARMEQAARPGTILISAATAALVDQRVSVRRRGPLTIKGLRSPMEAFELVGPARKPALGAKGPGMAHRFVGRQTELADLLRGIADGTRAITISGVAGAGKSRLLAELLRRRELTSWTVLRVDVGTEDSRGGLRPFVRMLRALLDAGPGDETADLATRLGAFMTTLGGVTPTDVDVLRRLLGLSPTIEAATYQPSAFLRSIHRVLTALAARQRVLLAVEDVHWLADDGIKLLNLLADGAGDGRLVLLQTLRAAPPGLVIVGRHLALPPLTDAAAKQLLEAALGTDGGTAARKSLILERADGIPLFLVELAKHAATSDEQAVPGTIQAVIGERMDRLPARCRELLRVAAVIGRGASLALLGAVLSSTDEVLGPIIRRVEDEGFMHRVDGPSGPSLVFDHALNRDVAFTTMVKATQRQVHRAVLHAYENLHASGLDEFSEILGTHALASGDWDRASTYMRRAAEQAILRSDHSHAIAFVGEALRALTLSDWPVDAKQRRELDLRRLLRVAYNAVGNYRERLVNLDRAETLAQGLGLAASLPSLWLSRASAMLHLGRVDEAFQLCTKARRTAARHNDVATGIAAGYSLSRAHFYAGRLAASLDSGGRSLALMGSRSRDERHGGEFGNSEVMLHTQRAQTYACQGQFVQARHSARSAVSLAERKDRAFDAALAAYGLGMVDFYEGKVAGSVATLEEAFKASSADGPHSIYAALAGLLSYAYFRAGRHADALGLCRDAIGYPESSLYFANWPLLFGSLLIASAGDPATAIRHAETVYKRARKGGYPIQRVWSDLALGHLYRATNLRAAQRHLERALAESSRIGLRPCRARALLELGNLQRARGDHDGATISWRKGRRGAAAIGLRLDGDAPFFTPEDGAPLAR